MFARIAKGMLIFYFIVVVIAWMALIGEKDTKVLGWIILGAGLIFGFMMGLFVELVNNVLDIRINSEKILAGIQSSGQNNSLLGSRSNSYPAGNSNINTSTPYTNTNVSNSSANLSLLGNAGSTWTCKYCYNTNEAAYVFCTKCGEKKS